MWKSTFILSNSFPLMNLQSLYRLKLSEMDSVFLDQFPNKFMVMNLFMKSCDWEQSSSTNESYYLSDEELCDLIRAQERTLRGNGADSIDPVVLMTVFREEVKATCNLSTYASFWHLQAIANVLKRKIKSVYPETTTEVGS